MPAADNKFLAPRAIHRGVFELLFGGSHVCLPMPGEETDPIWTES